jgi:hypothetical protein
MPNGTRHCGGPSRPAPGAHPDFASTGRYGAVLGGLWCLHRPDARPAPHRLRLGCTQWPQGRASADLDKAPELVLVHRRRILPPPALPKQKKEKEQKQKDHMHEHTHQAYTVLLAEVVPLATKHTGAGQASRRAPPNYTSNNHHSLMASPSSVGFTPSSFY